MNRLQTSTEQRKIMTECSGKAAFFPPKNPLQPFPALTYRAQHEIFKILKIILEKSCPEDHAAGLNVELINGAN